MITLDLVKQNLRIDGNDEDAYLTFLISVAVEYAKGITGIENNAEAPARYTMICNLLVAHWYSNREAVSVGSVNRLPYGVDEMLMNLSTSEGMF